MEDLLASEHLAEQHVFDLLRRPEEPISALLAALASYRQICLTITLHDFGNAETHESRLWQAHCASKNYFHVALANLRKRHAQQGPQQQAQPVETRKLMRLYLEFIKKSQVFYREYIFQLSTSSVGIPELEAVAQMGTTMKDKSNSSGESQPLFIDPALTSKVLKSAHQCLIYLGDLSRWRASEQLDKVPEFGPAMGYYGLAATLMPSSGLGHHQQAVVELEQRHHLYAIYHLYRALVVAQPHPNAANNLHAEFRKTNAAWAKGELIKKGPPNDPEASKHALVGWFVRLHSICYKGEIFGGYGELEREVLSQLTNGIKQRASDEKFEKLTRKMVMVNIAAQHWAGQRFQSDPNKPQHQQSFFYFFRFNLATFTSLLRLFYDQLKDRLLSIADNDAELVIKITPALCQILPSIRLYTMWLTSTVHMVVGLAIEPFLVNTIAQFWPAFAKAIDLIAQGFPIWDLEDVDDVTYMLEEESDTIEFQPLMDDKTMKTWRSKETGLLRKQSTDMNIVRSSQAEEMLQRVKNILADGLNLANGDDAAPIFLRGTRIFYHDESQIDELVVKPVVHEPAVTVAKNAVTSNQIAKPISYAAAAANGNTQKRAQAPPSKQIVAEDHQGRLNELKHMVSDLVDDDDGNNPVTPPQPVASHPAVISNGDAAFLVEGSDQEMTEAPKHVQSVSPYTTPWTQRSNVALTPPMARVSPSGNVSTYSRLNSAASIWDQTPVLASPHHAVNTNPGLRSPAMLSAHGHSRVNSASSVRSKTSQNISDSWTSLDNSLWYGASNGKKFSNAVARPNTAGRHLSSPNGQGG